MDEEQDLLFQSIAFSGSHVEVVYLEPRDSEGPIQEYRTLVVPVTVVAEQIPEVFDALQQLVDHALLVRRNPPERIRR
jgi:hypothetical protein